MAHTHWRKHALSGSALIAIALIAYFQARGITLLLAATLRSSSADGAPRRAQATPTLRLGAHHRAAAILARNAFDSTTGPLGRNSAASVPPLVRHDVDPLFAPACSTPQVIIVSEASDPRWSIAALRATDDARTELHRVGDQVMGQRIEFIGFNPIERSPAVWLSSSDRLCQALLFQRGTTAPKDDVGTVQSTASTAAGSANVPSTIASKIRKLSDTEYEIERSAIEQTLDSQVELTRNIRIVPELRDGKAIGIRVFGIRPGSLPSLLGLQNGDLLESIDGYSMTSPENALQVYAQLRRASALNVRLQRRGVSIAIIVHIR